MDANPVFVHLLSRKKTRKRSRARNEMGKREKNQGRSEEPVFWVASDRNWMDDKEL